MKIDDVRTYYVIFSLGVLMPTDNVLEYGMQMNIEDDSAASLQSSWKGTKKEEKKVEDS